MSKVVVNEPELSIFDDLREKLLEIRSKRDALAYNHEDLKRSNDNFNKIIIMLSLFTAFCETVKSQLGLTDPTAGYPDAVSNSAAILPIFLSTIVGIISSLLKFKKFPEKMEEITKATEKCNFSILRIRQLQENVNFQSPEVSLNTYNSEVMGFYREALDAVEKTMYPKSRGEYFATAQANIIKIHDSEKEYTEKILAIKKQKALLDTDHMEEDLQKNKRMVDLEAGHGLEKTACDEETLKAAALSKTSPNRKVMLNSTKLKDVAQEVVTEIKAAPLVAAIAESNVNIQRMKPPPKTLPQQAQEKKDFIKNSLSPTNKPISYVSSESSTTSTTTVESTNTEPELDWNEPVSPVKESSGVEVVGVELVIKQQSASPANAEPKVNTVVVPANLVSVKPEVASVEENVTVEPTSPTPPATPPATPTPPASPTPTETPPPPPSPENKVIAEDVKEAETDEFSDLPLEETKSENETATEAKPEEKKE